MNFVYPFLSPVMLVLSIPNVICLVALFIGAYFAADSLLSTTLKAGNNVDLHYWLIVSLLIVIFANNVHLVLVLVVWPGLLVWECIHFCIYIMYRLLACMFHTNVYRNIPI